MTTVDADPYQWPWDGDLSHERLAVIVAGAQQFWAGRTSGTHAVLEVLPPVLDRLRSAGAVVVWTRHGRAAHVRNSLPVVGSDDWQLLAPPPDGDLVVDAAGHDGCYGGPLDNILRAAGRDRIFMCGLGFEGPVHSTLRALNDRGYECLTITDACAPYDMTTAAAAISSITMSFGIFGAVAQSAQVLAAFPEEVLAR
jgi:nicotinamidase-related amidase